MGESPFFPTWTLHQKKSLLVIGFAAVLLGAVLGCMVAFFVHPAQRYTLELIAPGGGTYIISQRTGRIYAVEPYGEALYVADLTEWDDNPALKPGTLLRKGRPWNERSGRTPMAPAGEPEKEGQ